MTDARVVLTTAGSQEQARTIARALVERRLAACVNIVPRIESIYWWEGDIDATEEWLLLIKTTKERFQAVCDAIKELSTFELPECICITIEAGSESYLGWISENVRSRS
jgi:periplasmic divalent cation tolerance protein